MLSSLLSRFPKVQRVRALLPHLWLLVWPRRHRMLLGLLLMAVGRVAGLVLPASTKVLIDDVIGKGQPGLLLPLIGAVLAANALQGACSFALLNLLSKEAQRLIAELRRDVQAHIGRLSVSFYDAQKTGNLVSRIMYDVEGVRNLIGTGLVELLGGLIAAAGAFAVMTWLSPFLTLLTVAILGGAGAYLFRTFAALAPVFRERNTISGELTGRLTETLAGVRVVKAYGAEPREASVFARGSLRLLDNVLHTLDRMASLSFGSTVGLGLIGGAVMYLGAGLVLKGQLTVGGLFTFTMLLGFLVAPVAQVAAVGSQLAEALVGLERTREILAERPEDADPRRVVELPGVQGRIEFEEVGFEYEPGRPVLKGVSLLAEPGTVTALVGPSGAGKSTLISLVAAFHTATRGRVTVDGIDLASVRLGSYRRHLGVVLQDTFLFAGTIRENVAFARPEAGEAELLAACRRARVDEFAEALPQGYGTVVGERGVKLSGGQRQRVSIARALLADPRILILDEATSSLDTESEALIQAALADLMKGRTTFVIAHRLSTIRGADQILVVEAGEVVERGAHEALLQKRGRYFDMYTRQHGVMANLFMPAEEGEETVGARDSAAPRPRGGLRLFDP